MSTWYAHDIAYVPRGDIPTYVLDADRSVILRGLEFNLDAAHHARAPWQVRAALIAGAALVLDAMEGTG